MGVLIVHLKQIKNLRDADGIGKSDPYVMFHLVEDRLIDKSLGKHRSTVKKDDLNPVYNELFKFDGIQSLRNLKLHVKIMDEDIGLDDKLGACVVDIDSLDPSDTPVRVEKDIDRKRGIPGFKKTACIVLEISYHK